jgi:uroporphyrinogen-III synthase
MSNTEAKSLNGLRVISFESRRATEIDALIRKRGGDPFVAPALREAPLDSNEHVFAFAERLFAGEFDMMILLTGVGTRVLAGLLAKRYPASDFGAALGRITTVARGPKPAAALREMGVTPTILVPEPNTWREVLAVTDARTERRIAVQEYGVSNPELLDALRARGAEVTAVHVYEYALPEDTGPLKEAARRIRSGEADVVLFTTSAHVYHLFAMAGDIAEQLRKTVIASIGPTTSETLREHGIEPDLEPAHPKMGFLIDETAVRAREILARKRA